MDLGQTFLVMSFYDNLIQIMGPTILRIGLGGQPEIEFQVLSQFQTSLAISPFLEDIVVDVEHRQGQLQ